MKSRIVFMGTPDFALESLKALVKENANIVGVFTQPDKPKGRGYQLQAPPVKEYALKNNIPVYQPKSMRTQETLDLLKKLQPDFILVVAYGKMLPKEILDLPKFGCINVHGSLLPKYRGAAPIQWAVLKGEKETGVTIMYMAEGMDTGDMILKETTPIGENETSGELFDRLAQLGAKALLKAIALIEQKQVTREVQNENEATFASLLDKKMAEIDFKKTAQEVHNLIRGMNPWPIAYTTFEGKRMKVFSSRLTEMTTDEEPGTILANKENFLVACGDQKAIAFCLVLLEGGKKVEGKQFVATRTFQKKVILGK